MRVATDVGGTFTDYVILENGSLTAFKSLTTSDPSQGILERLNGNEISEFSHGTTAAVNAVLERMGGPLVFFTTKGFRDLVHIGRQARLNVYSFICNKPQVPVEHIVEVSERTTKDGTIINPLSEDDLKIAAKEYSKMAKVAVIGFINSYVNPKNELLAEKLLSNYFTTVIPSHKVRSEIREYERFCTSIIEGYCAPVVEDYVERLKPLSKQFYIMQSNGGRTHVDYIRAVNMIMSGPAGGVAATAALCKRLGIQNAIAYDMGGTSADVSAIVDGAPLYTNTVTITDVPIKTLAIDIESIGAGGGSISWIDDGGALKVGPASAGSQPGPACYDQGGSDFTVSDANLITGVLGENISEISLNSATAKAAGKSLCDTLALELKELSSGVIQIVNNNMVSALKRISIGKGYDPRQFALVSFGGAGPMHACALADAIGIKRIIIPPMAGAFSALGILSAPERFDYVQTILAPLDAAQEKITKALDGFHTDLREKLGKRYEDVIPMVSFDMRYFGQGHEINISVCDDLKQVFHARHEALFGFNMPNNPIEIVNVRLVVELPIEKLPEQRYAQKSTKIRSKRDMYPNENISVYNKDFFGLGIDGPAIIEEDTTTIYVSSEWKAKLDLYGVLQMERD